MNKPPKSKTALINIDKISFEISKQARVNPDPAKIDEYAAAILAGETLPPVDLYREGERFAIGDGHTRIKAHIKAGQALIEAYIHEGGAQAALLHAVRANTSKQHGVVRTQADGRNAIRLYLLEGDWHTHSDHRVGKACDLDHKTVAAVRSQMVAAGEIPEALERVGADGKRRQLGNSPVEPSPQPELFPSKPIAETPTLSELSTDDATSIDKPTISTPTKGAVKCYCGLLAWNGVHCMKHAAEAAQEKNRLSISTPEERAAKSGPGLYDQAERKAEEKKASVKTGKLHALLGQLEREHALINGWSQKVMIEGRLKPATMIEAMTVLPDAEVSAAVMSDDQFEVRVCFVDVILKKRLCWFIAEPPLPALQPFPATGVFPAPKTPAEKASYRETVDTNREAKHAAIAGEAKDLASPDKLGPFSVLYVDPPWQYSARVSESKSIEQQYPTLSIAELCALNVPSITAPRAVLYLWVTAPMIKEALQLLDAWGFVYKSQAVWIKGRNGAGMGHYWRVDHELLFVATKGNFGPSDPEVRVSSVLEYPRGRHSEKPRDVREYLDSLYSRDEHPRVELFARETAEGWVSIGNEIDGRDIREVLNPTKQMGLPRAATPKESATDTTLLSGALPQTEATKRGRCHFCELLNDCTLLGGKKLICAGCRTKDLRGRCAKCWTTKNDCRVIDDELQCASCQEVFSPKAKEEPQEETSSWPHWFCLICGFSCIKVEEWNTHCKDAHGRVASATPITINGNSCCVSSCVKGEVVPGSRLRDWLFFGASAVSFCTDKDKRWKGLQNSVDYHVGKGLIFKIDQYGDQYVGPKPTSKEAAAPDAVGPWANRALSQLRACTTREEFDQAYTKLEALASTLDERNELLSYREELRAKLPHESNVKPSAREAYVKSAEKNPEKAAELPPATGPELIHMQAWLVEHANLNSKGGYTLFEDEVRDVSLTPKQFASWQNDKRIKMRTPNWLEDMTADMKRCNTVGEGTRIFDAMIDLTVTTAERDKCRAVFSEWKHSKPATVPYNRTAPKPTRNKGKNEEKKVSKKAGRR